MFDTIICVQVLQTIVSNKDLKAKKKCTYFFIVIPKRPDAGSSAKNAHLKTGNSKFAAENHSSASKTIKRHFSRAEKTLTPKQLQAFKTLPKEKKQYILANWPSLALGTGSLGLVGMGNNGGGLLETRQSLGGLGGAANLNGLDGLAYTPETQSFNGMKSYMSENYNTPNSELTQLNGLNGLDSLTNLAGLNSLGQGTSLNTNTAFGISKLLGTDTGATGGLEQTANSFTQDSGILSNQQGNDISQTNIENALNEANGMVTGQQQTLNSNNKQFIGDRKWFFISLTIALYLTSCISYSFFFSH